jgi:insulysin
MHPTKLNASLWHKLDGVSNTPKVAINVIFRRYFISRFTLSSLVMSTAKNRCLSLLFESCANSILGEKVYDARLADSSYNISADTSGITLSVGGYNDKIAVLLQKLVKELVSINVVEDRFNVIKDDVGKHFVFFSTVMHWTI